MGSLDPFESNKWVSYLGQDIPPSPSSPGTIIFWQYILVLPIGNYIFWQNMDNDPHTLNINLNVNTHTHTKREF